MMNSTNIMEKLTKQEIGFVSILWFVAILTSQFYIFSSGIPQPSHYIIFLVFVFYTLNYNLNIPVSREHSILIKILFTLILYICFVDIYWALYFQNIQFVVSLVYWIFSLFLFVFTLTALDNHSNLTFFKFSIFIGIVFLAFTFLLGLGRFNFSPRYNGFFNDPNQMAYWVLCSFGVFYFVLDTFSYRVIISLSMISLFVILTSFSRSALLGYALISIGIGLRFYHEGKNRVRTSIVMISTLIVILIVYYNISDPDIFMNVYDRFVSSDFIKEAKDRGYYRILEYPQYIIFGAGQGLDNRFNATTEIHSTFMAILFYYGIIGCLPFLIILAIIFFKLDLAGKFILLGPLGYGLSTYGARTPIFWIFLASAAYYCRKKTINSRKYIHVLEIKK